MLGEFEVSQMLLDINEADCKESGLITAAERATQLLAVQNALNLILDWTEERQRRWDKFVGKEGA